MCDKSGLNIITALCAKHGINHIDNSGHSLPALSTKTVLGILLFSFVFQCMANDLPGFIKQALERYNFPNDSISIHVERTETDEEVISWRSDQQINPASTLKIITTYAGLDLLGSHFTWKTKFYIDAPIVDGKVDGNIYIKGSGDPLLINEALEQAVFALFDGGIKSISGDLIIDNSYFDTGMIDSKSVYRHMQNPYQALPDAANINFGTAQFNIVTEKYSSRPQVNVTPPLLGHKLFSRLRLRGGRCKNSYLDPKIELVPHQGTTTISFSGQYAKQCGNKTIYRVITSPDRLLHSVFNYNWAKYGGHFSGSYRYGTIPENARLVHTHVSPKLSDQIAVMNKKSNNVMTRQLFLTLGAEKHSLPGTLEKSRLVIEQWLKDKDINFSNSFIDNGSGLSRKSMITTQLLSDILNDAARHPDAQLFMDSLSVAGIDGTMRNRFRNHPAQGRLFIKTGTLNGVRAIAGYVNSKSGNKFTVATIQHHSTIGNGRGRAIQNLILDWAYQQ